jgi:hypothetical protein
MSVTNPPDFDDLVEVLRVRIGDADAISPGQLHSFRELMADQANVIPDR